MALRTRFPFHPSYRIVRWIVLLAGVCTQTCRADLIVGNANPMDRTVSEHGQPGAVTFTVINTGIDPVRITGYIARASPRFGPDDSGDIALDAIQVDPGVQLVCDKGTSLSGLVGASLNRQESCLTYVPFYIIDDDPFDEFNPVSDSADWAVLLQVSAEDVFTFRPVPDEIGHAYVHVVDDPVPEPEPNPVPEPRTATLVSSGVIVLSLLYRQRGRKGSAR